jgi:hypothetical protein
LAASLCPPLLASTRSTRSARGGVGEVRNGTVDLGLAADPRVGYKRKSADTRVGLD